MIQKGIMLTRLDETDLQESENGRINSKIAAITLILVGKNLLPIFLKRGKYTI